MSALLTQNKRGMFLLLQHENYLQGHLPIVGDVVNWQMMNGPNKDVLSMMIGARVQSATGRPFADVREALEGLLENIRLVPRIGTVSDDRRS